MPACRSACPYVCPESLNQRGKLQNGDVSGCVRVGPILEPSTYTTHRSGDIETARDAYYFILIMIVIMIFNSFEYLLIFFSKIPIRKTTTTNTYICNILTRNISRTI